MELFKFKDWHKYLAKTTVHNYYLPVDERGVDLFAAVGCKLLEN